MSSHRPTDETVFLVSGGAKGITAACVIRMAEVYGSRFILVGRSVYDGAPDPLWAEGVLDDITLRRAALASLKEAGEQPKPRVVQNLIRRVQSQREIRSTLRAIAERGGRAVYVSADVTDVEALERAVAEGARELGKVSGIIHGAGILADKLVQHKAVEDFERVVSVKVDGLRNLLSVVPPTGLDYLVLFSSVAGFYGNAAQVDYAVANEILNKIAYWVRHHSPDCHVLAIDWGPWDGGMVTPELKRQLAVREIPVIPVETGTKILTDLLIRPSQADEGHAPQVVVGSALLPPLRTPARVGHRVRLHRRLSLEANPFLRDHVIGGQAVLPTVCAVNWMVAAFEQLYPGYVFAAIDDYRVLKGIVFDDALSDAHVLDLTIVESGDDELRAEVLIWSEARDGRPRYHYTASVTLRRSPVEAPLRGHVDLSVSPVLKGSDLYRDLILFHGPSFQGIQEVLTMDASGLVMRCRLPQMSWETQGQFAVQGFNPYVADVQLQSLLVWSHYHLGSAGLPLRIAQGVQYKPLSFDADTYVTMQVTSTHPRSLTADVVVQAPDGVVCMEVQGAEITLSERLGELFQQNTLDLELAQSTSVQGAMHG
ncbi:MAG: SDR family NAD(P)-dependent oxidoreductase [Anaerolineae bacterium]